MSAIRKRRSSIWTLFDQIDKQQGRCRLCRKTYKTSGNTTNMKEHLRRKHLRHYLEIFPGGQPRDDLAKASKLVKIEKNPSEKEIPSFEIRLHESFVASEVEPYLEPETSCDYDSPSYMDLDKDDGTDIPVFNSNSVRIVNTDNDELQRALNFFIVRDCHSFDTVEGEGFKYFASVWQPHFRLPSRRSLLRTVEILAHNLSDMILEELGSVDHMTLTADIWTETTATNRPVKHFISLTSHYLHNFKRIARVIGVKEMALGYTKERIRAVLDDVLGRWNISKSSVIAFLTEEDDILAEGVRSYFGSDKHLHSFLHSLNVAVVKAFNDCHQFSEVVKQIKEIVTFCKENDDIMDRLSTEQEKNGCVSSEPVVLTQAVSSRWTSTALMLERFTLLYKHIACVAVDVEGFPVVINNRELESLKECLMLFQPFHEVMKEITAEKQMPLSKVIPFIRCLEKSLGSVHVTSEMAEDLKSGLSENIKKEFEEIETSRLHACSTILDPRFKTLHLTTATGAAEALVNIIEELSHSEVEEPDAKTDDPTFEILPDQKQATLWDHHEALMTKTNAPVSICVSGSDQNNVPLSLQQYLNSGVIHRNDDPIMYWQRYSFVYSDIAKVSLKFLSILGTVAPSDHFATYMSKLVTKTKSRLHPRLLENMIMLNFLSHDDWAKVHAPE